MKNRFRFPQQVFRFSGVLLLLTLLAACSSGIPQTGNSTQPAGSAAQPTVSSVQATSSPLEPTTSSFEATSTNPVLPTDSSAQATSSPVQPTGSSVQPTGSSAGQPPTVNVETTDASVKVPQTVPAGITTFVVKNTGKTNQSVSFGRLNSGVTLDQFQKALASSQTDPSAAVKLVSLVGGTNVPPSQSNQVTVDLKEGQYASLAFPDNSAPLVGTFTVGPASGPQAAAPTAQVTVDMADFSFTVPDTITAGHQVWEIKNSGSQWHELNVIKPHPGFTKEQFLQMAMSNQQASGQPPFDTVGYFGPSTQGETGWITVDLQPGTYWLVCFLPDLNGKGQPHVAEGMFKEINVK